jgi:hyperosmotically inducible periplasmic protein
MKTAIPVLIMNLVLLSFGCATPAVDDIEISTKVKGKLAADKETSAIKIGVDTTNRVVTLSGVVPTEREKAKAEQLARNTEGVSQVVNNITINPESLGATNIGEKTREAANDAAILAKIKAKLLTEGITGTNVDVVNGVVTLKGEIENDKKSTLAADIARSTEGVKSVDNQLVVKKSG